MRAFIWSQASSSSLGENSPIPSSQKARLMHKKILSEQTWLRTKTRQSSTWSLRDSDKHNYFVRWFGRLDPIFGPVRASPKWILVKKVTQKRSFCFFHQPSILGIKSIRFYLKIRTRKTQVRHELKRTLDQIVPSLKYDVIAVINQAVPQ